MVDPKTEPLSPETIRALLKEGREVRKELDERLRRMHDIDPIETTTLTAVVSFPSVTRKAILALLDARDFLAYQLAHANGDIDEDQLEELADEYLRHEECDDADLADGVAQLAMLIPDRLDAEVISTVFACDVDQASRVLQSVASSELTSGEASLPNFTTKRWRS